ncbi:MAG: RNA 2',3'-cyclic phosphodiesterase [Planctomycetes bacterium]|nr:RNA 2',3'-cyclic phosphodiesterase [Planctomycetota bacterium]
MPRLFIAIDLPPDVKEWIGALCHGISGARWVKPDQLHLTLRFIGDAEADQTADLKAALDKVNGHAFRMQIEGVGTFPSPGKRRAARVLWLGVRPGAELTTLQAQIEESVQSAGFPPETRPYHPHITLARFTKAPGNDLTRWLEKNRMAVVDPFPVSDFRLYESILGAAEARYSCTLIKSLMPAMP